MTTRNLTVVAGSFAYSFAVQTLANIKSRVQPGQYCSHFALAKPGLERGRLERVLKGPLPAAVIGLAVRPDADAVALCEKAGVPIVLIDEKTEGASTVAADDYRGGFLAGRHLAISGRKHIAVISGFVTGPGSYNAEQRIKGFRAALNAADLDLPETHHAQVQYYSYEEGRTTMTAWLKQKLTIDAIFSAAGDDCATGVLRAALDHGVKVPEDVAVLGYDDLETAKSTNPPLSTIRQPLVKMAHTAYELASDGSNDIASHPKSVVFDPDLVVRTSA